MEYRGFLSRSLLLSQSCQCYQSFPIGLKRGDWAVLLKFWQTWLAMMTIIDDSDDGSYGQWGWSSKPMCGKCNDQGGQLDCSNPLIRYHFFNVKHFQSFHFPILFLVFLPYSVTSLLGWFYLHKVLIQRAFPDMLVYTQIVKEVIEQDYWPTAWTILICTICAALKLKNPIIKSLQKFQL